MVKNRVNKEIFQKRREIQREINFNKVEIDRDVFYKTQEEKELLKYFKKLNKNNG